MPELGNHRSAGKPAAGGSGTGRKKPTIGRRKRRLRRTFWILGALMVLLALGGVWLVRNGRPETWVSGEKTDEITENLDRDLPPGAPQPKFTEVTQEAGLGGFDMFVGDRSSQLPEDMAAGLAWGDFDNDGDDDLFLVSGGGSLAAVRSSWASSQLYRNQGDGTFALVKEFPAIRVVGMGAAWGDYDGDGWLDLAVSGYQVLLLFHNQQGILMPGPVLPRSDEFWAGLTWGDFDQDRDLDLYVSGYVDYVEDDGEGRRSSDQYGTVVPYTLNPASFEPLSNMLLRNDGAGRFQDVATLYGVSNPEGRSLGALWQDFDADGRLDLYVANDISDNALYLNRGDTFEDAGLSAWVADYRGAMGLTSGDWNRDGDDDLFVTHWLAQENALYESRLVETGQGTPSGASKLTFADLAAPKGVGQIALQSVGWGTEFGDLDNDGWLDLVVSNGSTLEEPASGRATESKQLKRQRPMLLWNQAGDFFHDLAGLSPPFAEPHAGRGLALADYDQDGDLDVAMMRLDGGVALIRNDLEAGNWIELELHGSNGGRGEGSLVLFHAGDTTWRRRVTSASYLSQSSAVVHVGLGVLESLDQVEVQWHGGEPQQFSGLGVNARYRLQEGEAQAIRLGAPRLMAASTERQQILDFWAAQRAAMDAMKRDGDCEQAVDLFRQALALDPAHADSRYYLANCLAVLEQSELALAELGKMREQHPDSHRAHKRWAVLRAQMATATEDLQQAVRATQRALQINQEETGSLQLLAELSLMIGDAAAAEQHLEHLLQTNDRSVGALFLSAYLAWSQGDGHQDLLEEVRQARGPDWKPEGAVAEGDVAVQMHSDETPLARFWESWDGKADVAPVFRRLRAFLLNPWS